MTHDPKAHLFDIQRAGRHIIAFTSEVTFEEYKNNYEKRSAVERQFMLVGEAMNRLFQDAPDIARRVTDYRSIIAFRNVLIHAYDQVNDEAVWEAIEESLPTLLAEVTALLEELDTRG
jgi:uncharacterized protein with HEPN domain